MTERIRIAGVCERDLDLLLMEELVASPALRVWFARLADLGELKEGSPAEVHRSVTHSTGESDLEVFVTLADGRRAGMLIENKIDAGLQRRQSERYRDRAAARLAEGKCSIARTVIVAPAQYFGSSEDALGFDATTTYESIDEWFREFGATGDRAIYKRALLAAAVEKSSLGYQRIADQAMTDLWRFIWELAQVEAPELNMREPIGRPAGSTFVFFSPDGFPASRGLVYKFRHGNVDIVFPRWGARLTELRTHLGPVLPEGGKLERASKAAVIRVKVPPVDVSWGSEAQRPALIEGLRQSSALLRWYRANRLVINAIA